MSKTPVIILSLLILTGCSSAKLSKTGASAENNKSVSVREVLGRNFANSDFSIKKVEVNYFSDGEFTNFIAGIKFKYPSTWLISIRSSVGLEIARIYVDKDSVLVNSRLQRKIYAGNCESFERKYGITPFMIPMFLGDLICSEIKANDIFQCEKGEIQINDRIGDLDIESIIKCSERKVERSTIKRGDTEMLNVRIEKTKRKNNIICPEKILLRSGKNRATLRINAVDFDMNQIESILFIPGKGYEREIL